MKKNAPKVGCSCLAVAVIALVGLFVCSAFVPWTTSAQTSPPVIAIDAPGAGTGNGQGTVATAINDVGTITGYYYDSTGACHAFVRSPNGSYTISNGPDSGSCPKPTSINGSGDVAGIYYTSSNFGCPSPPVPGCGGFEAFVWFPGGTDMILFSWPYNPATNYNPGTTPTSINNIGLSQIVGYYGDYPSAGQPSSAFLRQWDGTFISFTVPDCGDSTFANGINYSGTIVGTSAPSNPPASACGFLRATDGTYTIIRAPNAVSTGAVAINTSGEIAGFFQDTNNAIHGYVQATNGTFTTFDVPGACASCIQVIGLSDSGAVVGNFWASSSSTVEQVYFRAASGTFTTFTPPGVRGGSATAINKSRGVVGTYQDANGASHGFLRPGVPAVDFFSPTSGPAGTTVIIAGAHFLGATRVAFNRVAGSFTVNSDSQITATVPVGATTGQISVTTPWGTGWSYSGTPFTVTPAGLPTISSFSPAKGSVGWTVTLTGTNLSTTTGVSFNGTPATTMWATSDTQFNAKVPSGATSGPITVTNSVGSATSSTSFTVTPHINSFTPASGTMGTTVTILGTNFTGATRVAFHGVTASYTVVSDTEITASVPGGATTGSISVTTPNGTAWSSSFTAASTAAPTISSFSPASGSVSTTVTITGTNFTGTTGVSINGTATTTFWTTSDTQLKVTIPSGATSGPITVTNTAGTTSSASSLTVN